MCHLLIVFSLVCANGDIRLSGGVNDNEGLVEICYNATWGQCVTTCGDPLMLMLPADNLDFHQLVCFKSLKKFISNSYPVFSCMVLSISHRSNCIFLPWPGEWDHLAGQCSVYWQ